MQAEEIAIRELANGIVMQAVTDYRNALKGISYDKKHTPESIINEVENFFHSYYYRLLTKVDADYLLERIRKEHFEQERSKYESNTNTSNA